MSDGVIDDLWRKLTKRLIVRFEPKGDTTTREELLRRAARCYLTANLMDDATRLFLETGDGHAAGLCLERLGRYEEAARTYRRIPEWDHAARCFLRAGLPAEAGEALVMAEDHLQAGWVLAHLAQHYVRATALATAFVPNSEAERLGREVVLARCEAGTQHPVEAAVRLGHVAAAMSQIHSIDPVRNYVWNWCFDLAEVLRRPDLTAGIHAAAVTAGVAGAEERWQEWTAGLMDEPVKRMRHG